VTLKLIESIALPILMYSLEALSLNKSELCSLNHSWTRAFEKVFSSFNKDIIKQCKFFNGYLNTEHYYGLKTMSFLTKLAIYPNIVVKAIYLASEHEDIASISTSFNCTSNYFVNNFKSIIVNQFRDNMIL